MVTHWYFFLNEESLLRRAELTLDHIYLNSHKRQTKDISVI